MMPSVAFWLASPDRAPDTRTQPPSLQLIRNARDRPTYAF